MNAGDGWRIRLYPVAGGNEAQEFSAARNVYDPAWIDERTLVAVSEENGIANLVQFDVEMRQTQPLTNVSGAAVAPVANPVDGSIWFLSLYPRGYDVRRLAADRREAALARFADSTLVPAVPLPPRGTAIFAQNPVSAPRAFDLSARLLRAIPLPAADADGFALGASLVSVDIIGRSELSATAMLGDASEWRGASGQLIWRGMRPFIRAQLFAAEQRVSASRSAVPYGRVLDARLLGGQLALEGSREYDRWAARYRIGGTAGALRNDSSLIADRLRSGERVFGFVNGGLSFAQRHGRATSSESITADVDAGRSLGSGFTRGVASASLAAAGYTPLPISLDVTYGRTTGASPAFEQFAPGGGVTPLLDRAQLSQRIVMPVLPVGVARGTSVFSYRAAATLQSLSWYLWGGSTAAAGSRFTEWHRVVGAEWTQSVAHIPMAGTPAARAVIGVGESLDLPYRRKLRVYAGLVLDR